MNQSDGADLAAFAGDFVSACAVIPAAAVRFDAGPTGPRCRCRTATVCRSRGVLRLTHAVGGRKGHRRDESPEKTGPSRTGADHNREEPDDDGDKTNRASARAGRTIRVSRRRIRRGDAGTRPEGARRGDGLALGIIAKVIGMAERAIGLGGRIRLRLGATKAAINGATSRNPDGTLTMWVGEGEGAGATAVHEYAHALDMTLETDSAGG